MTHKFDKIWPFLTIFKSCTFNVINNVDRSKLPIYNFDELCNGHCVSLQSLRTVQSIFNSKNDADISHLIDFSQQNISTWLQRLVHLKFLHNCNIELLLTALWQNSIPFIDSFEFLLKRSNSSHQDIYNIPEPDFIFIGLAVRNSDNFLLKIHTFTRASLLLLDITTVEVYFACIANAEIILNDKIELKHYQSYEVYILQVRVLDITRTIEHVDSVNRFQVLLENYNVKRGVLKQIIAIQN